jgi:hypothetical protein
MLVDNQTPNLIRTLQNKNIKVIALTMCLAGQYFFIPQLEINRLQELKTFGFDFKQAFPHLNRYEFHQLSHKNRHPLYQDGVLFTAGYDKGNVLLAFLKKIAWKPSRIIFVDNKKKNILSVMSAAEKLKTPFLGFLYKAAYKLPGGFDEKIAQFQIKYLIEHETLLDDEAAVGVM